MKVGIVVGTRPEIIKMAPIIKHCKKLRGELEYVVIHSGQHYSPIMDRIFFDDLGIEYPEQNLGIISKSPRHQGEHTGRIMEAIEKVFKEENLDMVLVEGDTNTVLAAAICAAKLHIKLGHVEAGLRSYDRTMAEEINRVLTDHISDYLFIPTEHSKKFATMEGIPASKTFVTGNTIVDVVKQNLPMIENNGILGRLGVEKQHYMLVTAHRQENVDVKHKLAGILAGMELVYKEFGMPVIYPMHPRTKKMINELGVKIPDCMIVIDPLGFHDFLKAEKDAKMIFTDSGGVQEESCILNVPCVTLRENTERPETLDIGANALAGTSKEAILKCAKAMFGSERNWKQPFGDGRAAEKIVRIISGLPK